MLDYIAFLSCLQFAVSNSVYCNTILKPKQVICLEYVYLKKDVLCVLPTGYGKSLIFHLIPALMFARARLEQNAGSSLWNMNMSMATTIVVVVSPLNALISNQIARLCSSGIRATVLCVKHVVDEDTEKSFECDSVFAIKRNYAVVTITSYSHTQSRSFLVNTDDSYLRARHIRIIYVQLSSTKLIVY